MIHHGRLDKINVKSYNTVPNTAKLYIQLYSCCYKVKKQTKMSQSIRDSAKKKTKGVTLSALLPHKC